MAALATMSMAATTHVVANCEHPASREALFHAENDVSMTKMMAGMDAKPSKSIDRDFIAMMIPHHQGAIDMAQNYLRFGDNEQLRRIAQEIIVDQAQEITAMHVAVGDPLPAQSAAATRVPRWKPQPTTDCGAARPQP